MGEPHGDFIDDDHRVISEFAATYLDEEEQESFVDSLLERRGYQRVTSWAPPAPPDPAAGGQRPPLVGKGGTPAARGQGGQGGGGQRSRSQGGQQPRGYFGR